MFKDKIEKKKSQLEKGKKKLYLIELIHQIRSPDHKIRIT
jgi:hypothetical protein